MSSSPRSISTTRTPSSVPIFDTGPTMGRVTCDIPRKCSFGPAALTKIMPQVFSKQRDVIVEERNRASESGLCWSDSTEASAGVPNQLA